MEVLKLDACISIYVHYKPICILHIIRTPNSALPRCQQLVHEPNLIFTTMTPHSYNKQLNTSRVKKPWKWQASIVQQRMPNYNHTPQLLKMEHTFTSTHLKISISKQLTQSHTSNGEDQSHNYNNTPHFITIEHVIAKFTTTERTT